MTQANEPLAAMADQLAAHAETIRRLDAQQAADRSALTARTDALAALASALGAQVAALRLPAADDDGSTGDDDAPGYQPAPARRWWKLSGRDRDQAAAALRAWVGQVYRPGYGQLAAALGPCWDQHPLCLYGIDILAELWSVLYLGGKRTPAVVSAQAEYQARILPALAEQMATETTRCPHGLDHAPASRRRQDTP